jgi:hypothetical protein
VEDVNGNIYIYRKEEFYKVLIHELLHSNYADEKIMEDTILNSHVCSAYPILLHEIYVEALATILHLFYSQCVKGVTSADTLETCFEVERKYAQYMRQKIFEHYHITSIRDILKSEGSTCKQHFPQETNVFSYYIFKPILLSSMSEFGEWMQTHTEHLTLRDSLSFFELIRRKMEMEFPKMNLREFEIEHHIPKNTMRMTYWG